jgi:hypothetical protein
MGILFKKTAGNSATTRDAKNSHIETDIAECWTLKKSYKTK